MLKTLLIYIVISYSELHWNVLFLCNVAGLLSFILFFFLHSSLFFPYVCMWFDLLYVCCNFLLTSMCI